MEARFRFVDGSRTDKGCVRTVNEDACLLRGDEGLWAVADGMGGHWAGQWASDQIVSALATTILPDDLNGAMAAVSDALDRVNWAICKAGELEGAVIGSTVAILLIRGGHYALLWAGDSRVYRIRDGNIALLTTDHTQVEQMVADGILGRDEVDDHPMAHVLMRAVGGTTLLSVDRKMGEVRPGDIFLLCSDGLTRTVKDTELMALLGDSLPGRAAGRLVERALARGAADNVTAVVVGCDETTCMRPGKA